MMMIIVNLTILTILRVHISLVMTLVIGEVEFLFVVPSDVPF